MTNFVPHLAYNVLPLENATNEQCTEKWSLFTVRITRNTYINVVWDNFKLFAP